MEPTSDYKPLEDIVFSLYSFFASLRKSDLVDVSDEEEEKKLAKSPFSEGSAESHHPPPTHHKILTPIMCAIPGHAGRRLSQLHLAVNLASDA